jgi:predicted methyltransferase
MRTTSPNSTRVSTFCGTLLAAALTTLAVGCQSSPSSTDPTSPEPQQEERTAVPVDINKRFLDPELLAEDFVERWEIESREVYSSRKQIVAALQLESGDRIADIGTGTGLFLEPLAAAVGPSGKVFATDISLVFLEHVRNRVKENNWVQVQPILSGMRTTALLEDSIDVAFTCDVYHHFEYHEDMLSSIHSALRPGGTLVIVDFERIPGVTREWLLEHVRASKETVIQEVLAAGFELEAEVPIEGFEENYLLRFTAK